MARRVVTTLVAGAVVAAVLSMAPPAGAGGRSATAYGLEPSGQTDCGVNPIFEDYGRGVGTGFGEDGWSTRLGDPNPGPPVIVPSPLFDNFDFNPGSWGFGFDAVDPAGTLRGLYAAIGDPSLEPSVTIEFFMLYACGVTTAESDILVSCYGPYGTCPQTVDEAMTPTVALTSSEIPPGQTFSASGTGCFGGSVTGTLRHGAAALDSFGPLPVTDAGTYSGTLTVPASAAPGTSMTVEVACDVTGIEPGVASFTVTAGAGASTTTTTAPAPVTTPRFTG